MFKHLLIPVDGSALSRKAVKAGVTFAKEAGARITIYHALEIIPPYVGGEFVPPDILEQVDEGAQKQAHKIVASACRLVEGASVPCESLITKPSAPYLGIVEAARKRKCDAVVIASHGRTALGTMFLGSTTMKVLRHSKVPVVVIR